jgi:hypothetical protein
LGPLGGAVSAVESAPSPAVYFANFKPLTAECYALQGRVSTATFLDFRRLQALLGHTLPSCSPAAVIEFAFKSSADAIERRKFAKGVCARPGAGAPNGRHIPSDIRQAVYERDGLRCAFVSMDGMRCESCERLEFDHIEPIAIGGKTTAGNLRLLCRKHNQFEAKRRFGPDFIRGRQEHARADAVRKRMRNQENADARPKPTEAAAATLGADAGALQPAEGRSSSATGTSPGIDAIDSDVIRALRALRFSMGEARQGAEL